MGCYICGKCGCVDNTSTGGYCENRRNKEELKCSECNFGKWHGVFDKKHWSEYYTKEEWLELEKRKDGSILNATEYFKKQEELE